MTNIDGNISDLFFNLDHHAAHDSKGQFVEHDQLEQEADFLLGCLKRLGVETPTVEELVEDFKDRV